MCARGLEKTPAAIRDALDSAQRKRFESEYRAALARAADTLDLEPVLTLVQRTWCVRAVMCLKPAMLDGVAADVNRGAACDESAEGGSQSFRFATRATESGLGDHVVLRWGRKPRTGYFLRAEGFYNVATEIERLDADPGSPPLLPAYGGVSPHERSHGESFPDLVIHRFGPNGLTPTARSG